MAARSEGSEALPPALRCLGQSAASAINAFGWSVGSSGGDAVLWSPSGKATVLQDAGGQGYSAASAINAFGWSVGFSKVAFGYDAVLWSPSGKATVLGSGRAVAINDFGWSVGNSYTASGSDAVLWSPSGEATDLGAVLGPAWSDTAAVGLNDLGDILGNGTYNGGYYGFLLTPAYGGGVNSWSLASVSAASASDPVPELSTWVMMVVGFIGLGLGGYRQSRKARMASFAD
jgi:hypothetical protein